MEPSKKFSITAKIDATDKIPADWFKPEIPAPHSVKIELTRNCNYRCSFCVNSELANKGTMPEEKYIEYITKIRDAGVKELGVFYFGESFIVPWLPRAIKHAKDIGFEYVFLTTNGSLASKDKVKECMEAGLDSLKFSLNQANEEQFKEVTRVSPKLFERVLTNIKDAHEVREAGGYNCGLYASFIEYTGEQRTRMEATLDRVRPYLDEIYALPLFDQAGNINNEAWEFVGGNPGRADNRVPPVPCWALFREGHVNFDGTMNACCFGVDDKRFIHGDLNTHTFMEVWNSNILQGLRQAHLNKDIENTPCNGCIKKVVNQGPK